MSDLTPNSSPSVRPFASEEPSVTVPVFRPPVSPEDQTLFFPHTEGTPPSDPPTRIPHLGHAALFLAIAGLLLLFTQLILLSLTHPSVVGGKAAGTISPKLLVGSEALTYIATLTISWFIFP